MTESNKPRAGAECSIPSKAFHHGNTENTEKKSQKEKTKEKTSKERERKRGAKKRGERSEASVFSVPPW
jgi:hypothetical protein